MMNEHALPEFFQQAYKKYLTLQSAKTEREFWDEIRRNNTATPEELDKHLEAGLLLLSNQVDALGQKVKAKMLV
ncbi:hypothetical protein [Dyadobacter arcticus]|uniref:Uncharacterized protein n=1 Tax=Dyadobacter arcticus TaxID=1078754 RepID=A0ABX0UI80_9BACT|nr:hypothetical protein [Dyadobacter arcticus]NIJ50916.1 hypothetical protein [Dyadobacter arcticus]